ncbi:MAG: AhpC/TSA family protein [Chromatiaceae bacterium]|nr:AhpC/TSA family protein [Chromatiaceae bacterium]MCP5430919.1 AhpC/TSA family protein [Chromatiaceae bacterium]
MSNLFQTIAEYDAAKAKRVPADVLQTMAATTRQLETMGITDRSLKTGDRAPDFLLPNHLGRPRRLTELLADSVVVLSFYRGGWCPYCNMELHALQQSLPEIRASGAELVAISPELPDKTLDTQARHALEFDVLSDRGNRVSEAFGLAFELPEQLRPIYRSLGIDIPAYNGDTSFTLPVPATYVVDSDGIIRFHFVNADYTRRLEPDELLRALRGQWPMHASPGLT